MTGTNEAYFPSSHPLSKNYDPEKNRMNINLGILIKIFLILFFYF